MMKEKVAIAIGVLLLVGGAFGAVITYQNAESGSSFLSVMGKGLVARGLSREAAQSVGQKIPVIVAYQPVSKGLSVKGLSVRAQDMKAMAVRRLGVYGFALSHEEAIPMFGMVVGKAPAENIGRIARSPGVKAVVKNKFISVGGETRLFSQSYASPEEFVRFHEANELPSAENQVIAIVDSRAPRELWVENAVSVRGEHPFSGFWHGAVVSRVAHEVAPNAEITVVKTLDEYGTGRLSTILKGLETAATMKPRADVINLSLGTSPGPVQPPRHRMQHDRAGVPAHQGHLRRRREHRRTENESGDRQVDPRSGGHHAGGKSHGLLGEALRRIGDRKYYYRWQVRSRNLLQRSDIQRARGSVPQPPQGSEEHKCEEDVGSIGEDVPEGGERTAHYKRVEHGRDEAREGVDANGEGDALRGGLRSGRCGDRLGSRGGKILTRYMDLLPLMFTAENWRANYLSYRPHIKKVILWTTGRFMS